VVLLVLICFKDIFKLFCLAYWVYWLLFFFLGGGVFCALCLLNKMNLFPLISGFFFFLAGQWMH